MRASLALTSAWASRGASYRLKADKKPTDEFLAHMLEHKTEILSYLRAKAASRGYGRADDEGGTRRDQAGEEGTPAPLPANAPPSPRSTAAPSPASPPARPRGPRSAPEPTWRAAPAAAATAGRDRSHAACRAPQRHDRAAVTARSRHARRRQSPSRRAAPAAAPRPWRPASA